MSDTVTIRPITPSDRADWERLWDLYLEFYHTSVTPEIKASSFAGACLQKSHEDRPSHAALLRHAFLEGDHSRGAVLSWLQGALNIVLPDVE